MATEHQVRRIVELGSAADCWIACEIGVQLSLDQTAEQARRLRYIAQSLRLPRPPEDERKLLEWMRALEPWQAHNLLQALQERALRAQRSALAPTWPSPPPRAA